MNPVKREYQIVTSKRTGTVTVIEYDDRFEMTVIFSRYGELGDKDEIDMQMLPILLPMEDDPRPIDFRDPNQGQRAIIDKDKDNTGFAICMPSDKLNG